MRTQGYARATTKEIARAAGFSEAALYEHFQDKTEIFLRILVGTGDVRRNLEEVVATAVEFYTDSFPIAASVFSSQELLSAHRDRLRELGTGGPHTPQVLLARYLEAEQRLGRIDPSADPAAMAQLLLGACFQQAFLAAFSGDPAGREQRADLARRLVGGVLGATLGGAGG
jgi:AcrR family transcriptional regulator